jgi:cytochrome P450
VTLWWASGNRDESVFANPYAFDITRNPNPHIAFGRGTHFCLGAALARMEIRVVVDALLDRVGEVSLTGPVEYVRSNKHAGVRHMPVHLSPR